MTIEEKRRMLALWLAEWNAEKNLPEEPEVPAGGVLPPPTDSAFTVEAAGETLAPGDIVLLPPVGETTSRRPVYVALAEKHGAKWTAVPFSRFSLPATEGELALVTDFDPIKVLCLWNFGNIPEPLLSHGWRVGKLKATDRKMALAFLCGEIAKLPEDRRGPPLRHPLDPRHDYLEEEKALWFDFQKVFYFTTPEKQSSYLQCNEPVEDAYGTAAEKNDDSPFSR